MNVSCLILLKVILPSLIYSAVLQFAAFQNAALSEKPVSIFVRWILLTKVDHHKVRLGPLLMSSKLLKKKKKLLYQGDGYVGFSDMY